MTAAGKLWTQELLVHSPVIFERPLEHLKVFDWLAHVREVLGREGLVCARRIHGEASSETLAFAGTKRCPSKTTVCTDR
jgi:hypothetical protein